MTVKEDKVKTFFDKQSEVWSDTYYSENGSLLPRIKRFMDAIQHFGNPVLDQNILDIGCGTGQLARAFADTGANMTACDLSEAMMDQARTLDTKNTVKWVALPNDPEKTGRIYVPVEGSQFDVIVLSSVLEYVLDLEGSLKEIQRLLKPGGMVYATLPIPEHPYRKCEPLKSMLMHIPIVRWIVRHIPRLAAFELAYLSVNRMPYQQWADVFSTHGLQFLEYEEVNETPLWMAVAKKVEHA